VGTRALVGNGISCPSDPLYLPNPKDVEQVLAEKHIVIMEKRFATYQNFNAALNETPSVPSASDCQEFDQRNQMITRSIICHYTPGQLPIGIAAELSPNLGDARSRGVSLQSDYVDSVVELYTADDFGNWAEIAGVFANGETAI
jgi:hypothetical protein